MRGETFLCHVSRLEIIEVMVAINFRGRSSFFSMMLVCSAHEAPRALSLSTIWFNVDSQSRPRENLTEEPRASFVDVKIKFFLILNILTNVCA